MGGEEDSKLEGYEDRGYGNRGLKKGKKGEGADWKSKTNNRIKICTLVLKK